MSNLDFFMDTVARDVGDGLRFQTWQAAYEHYFVFVTSNDKDSDHASFREDFRRCYKHEISNATDEVNYEAEFRDAFKKGIVDQYDADIFLAKEDSLPPAFRKEAALLLVIMKRHGNIVLVADYSLMCNEAFWRKALSVNKYVADNLRTLLRCEWLTPDIKKVLHDMMLDDNLMVPIVSRTPSLILYMPAASQLRSSAAAQAAEAAQPGITNQIQWDEPRKFQALIEKLGLYIIARKKNPDDYFYGKAISTFFGGYASKEKTDAAQALIDWFSGKGGNESASIDPKHLPMLQQGGLGAILREWGTQFNVEFDFTQDVSAVNSI